jgi:hypothetical protein
MSHTASGFLGVSDSLNPTIESSSVLYRRAGQRDPDWVPRPRNSFIIFRCEYCKIARKSDKFSDRSEKTLSKRAAEEWRHLSTIERDRYKLLADQEKAAHALQNPFYRFKPMRRTRPVVRQPTGFRARGAQIASLITRSERGVSSVPQVNNFSESAANHSPTVIAGRSSMPNSVAQEAVVIPAEHVSAVPDLVDFNRFSNCEMNNFSLPYGLPPSDIQMTFPGRSDGTFACGMDYNMDVCGAQVGFFLLFDLSTYPSVPYQDSPNNSCLLTVM